MPLCYKENIIDSYDLLLIFYVISATYDVSQPHYSTSNKAFHSVHNNGILLMFAAIIRTDAVSAITVITSLHFGPADSCELFWKQV